MPLLLHLSDLHLATPARDPDIGAYKIDIVPRLQRQRRATYLENTLDALRTYLTETDQELDAVVVTGDVTLTGSPEGFPRLPPLLQRLGDRLPPNEQIVVVPGNHDVKFDTPPGSPERYAAFVDGVRAEGYVTPLLDGVDDAVGGAGGAFLGPLLVRETYVIAAMNSADYAGARSALPAELTAELQLMRDNNTVSPALLAEIERLRLFDAARINRDQFRALHDAIETVDAGGHRVRIAALHHQLAPVSTDEEVKALETLVNLGELRMFLADNRFELVLHGHKHLPRVVEDIFLPYGERADDPSAGVRSIVIGCGAIDSQPGAGREIAKLIEIDASLPRLRHVRVTSVRAVSAGARLPTTADGSLRVNADEKSVHQLGRRAQPTAAIVRGSTAAEVHEQLEEMTKLERSKVGLLVCIVDDGSSASVPPPTYPERPADERINDWFDETVAWWQNPSEAKGKPFTHGQFIRAWRSGSGAHDQVQAVIRALAAYPDTSRAVITLLDPPTDLENKRSHFPAFCSVQFTVSDDSVAALALFRKQEMRYWWPINAAEISRLQADVVHGLRNAGREVHSGSITTITPLPVFDPSLPKVAVPRIDQLVWTEAGQLTLMKFAMAFVITEMPDRGRTLDELRGMIRDLRPAEEAPTDGAPVSTRGLLALRSAVRGLCPPYTLTAAADRALQLLERLEADSGRLVNEDLPRTGFRQVQRSMRDTVDEFDRVLGEFTQA
jgi:3',5'-cyclic AMP phosphodiesterase CpdA